MAVEPPDLFADFGDGVAHHFGQYLKGATRRVARCGLHRRGRDYEIPERIYLPGKIPAGVEVCSYCAAGTAAPKPRGQRSKPRPDAIPNAPLRRAFEESGMTAGEVAVRLGWVATRRDVRLPDAGRVNRMLGLRPSYRRCDGQMMTQRNVTRVNAAKVYRAIGLDPVDVGL